MTEHSREWTTSLTDLDRIKIRMIRDQHAIIEFSAQYEILYAGHWRKVTRYDNAHGYPHRHVHYPYNEEYRQIMHVIDNNEAFTEAVTVIKNNFMKFRENYILRLESQRGGES